MDHVTSSQSIRVRVERCPACDGKTFTERLHFSTMTIMTCAGCGLACQNPQPSDDELARIYGPDYFIGSGADRWLATQFNVVKRGTARMQLSCIASYLSGLGHVPNRGRLIEIGCGHGNFLIEAKSRGYTVQGIEFSKDAAEHANEMLGSDSVLVGTTLSIDLPSEAYDVCVLADVIEHVRDPHATISYVSRILKPGGLVFISTPSTASWSARLMGSFWMQFKLEHLFYFDPHSLERLLARAGFRNIQIYSGWKSLTADYIAGHFEKYPVPGISWAVCTVNRLLPRSVSKRLIPVTASGIYMLGLRG
jgi:2-polyprenyl-3-methyl-5-hydroxy-6-metoxy-1,4-benzoquinol methylase